VRTACVTKQPVHPARTKHVHTPHPRCLLPPHRSHPTWLWPGGSAPVPAQARHDSPAQQPRGRNTVGVLAAAVPAQQLGALAIGGRTSARHATGWPTVLLLLTWLQAPAEGA
jgi:hypothetical protein